MYVSVIFCVYTDVYVHSCTYVLSYDLNFHVWSKYDKMETLCSCMIVQYADSICDKMLGAQSHRQTEIRYIHVRMGIHSYISTGFSGNMHNYLS